MRLRGDGSTLTPFTTKVGLATSSRGTANAATTWFERKGRNVGNMSEDVSVTLSVM